MAMAPALGHLTNGSAFSLRDLDRLGYGGARHCMVPSFRFASRRRTGIRVQARPHSRERATEGREDIALAAAEERPNYQSTSVPPNNLLPDSPHYIGSPLLWIGVGVGISVLFSWAAGYAKKQVMQQALKTMMGPNTFAPGAPPFPFPMVPPVAPSASAPPTTATSPPLVFEKVQVETTVESTTENNKPAFSDVTTEKKPEEPSQTQQKEEQPKVYFKDPEIAADAGPAFEWNMDGASSTTGSSSSTSDGKTSSYFSVDTLEKMLEDPTVQQMVYPYLPEEMRNPSTFKWMMQNPQFRSQLQEMLNNMTEEGAWKSGQMADVLKNFNPNNQDLKQQFEQIGLTPEEVMAKMVANPDIAMAFQNPKIQAALLDCSQNPANITKYQNDKEIMDVFNKIAELFPMKGF